MNIISSYINQQQILKYWCWAAVASCVAKRFDRNSIWTQSELASEIIDPICQNITNDTAAQCNKPMDIIQVLKKTGNYAWDENSQLEFEYIIKQINSNFPIVCEMMWSTDNVAMGHVVSIIGYNLITNEIIIADPAPDDDGSVKPFSMSYNEFCVPLGYRNGGTWQKSIGTQANNR